MTQPACTNRWAMFEDITDPEEIQRALNICSTCPILSACKTSDPGPGFDGVWAGTYYTGGMAGRSHPAEPMACGSCGEAFYTPNRNRRYCSSACITAADLAAQRAKRAKERKVREERPKPHKAPTVQEARQQEAVTDYRTGLAVCVTCKKQPRAYGRGRHCLECHLEHQKLRARIHRRHKGSCEDCGTPVDLTSRRCRSCHATQRNRARAKPTCADCNTFITAGNTHCERHQEEAA